MAKGGFSRGAIEETQLLIKTPCAKVQQQKKRDVEFPGRNMVTAAFEDTWQLFM
jgi:hypothetical protein